MTFIYIGQGILVLTNYYFNFQQKIFFQFATEKINRLSFLNKLIYFQLITQSILAICNK